MKQGIGGVSVCQVGLYIETNHEKGEGVPFLLMIDRY